MAAKECLENVNQETASSDARAGYPESPASPPDQHNDNQQTPQGHGSMRDPGNIEAQTEDKGQNDKVKRQRLEDVPAIAKDVAAPGLSVAASPGP